MKTTLSLGLAAAVLGSTAAAQQKAVPPRPAVKAVKAKAVKPQDKKKKAGNKGKAMKAVPMRAMRLVAGGQNRNQPDQKELKRRYDAKLGEAWVKNAAWVTDYDKALAAAESSGKQVFLYLTRSYAP